MSNKNPSGKIRDSARAKEIGSRKKGVKHKSTQIREKIAELKATDPERFEREFYAREQRYWEELDRLQGTDFVKYYAELRQYAMPKKRENNINLPPEISIVIKDHRNAK